MSRSGWNHACLVSRRGGAVAGKRWQPQPRLQPAGVDVGERDGAPRALRDLLDDREPEPGAGHAARVVRSVEAVEHVGEGVGRYARTVVPDGERAVGGEPD